MFELPPGLPLNYVTKKRFLKSDVNSVVNKLSWFNFLFLFSFFSSTEIEFLIVTFQTSPTSPQGNHFRASKLSSRYTSWAGRGEKERERKSEGRGQFHGLEFNLASSQLDSIPWIGPELPPEGRCITARSDKQIAAISSSLHLIERSVEYYVWWFCWDDDTDIEYWRGSVVT